MERTSLKKNLLDLEFNKWLQLYNTGIIIFATYIIGVLVAFLTRQLDYSKQSNISIIMLVSLPFLFGSVSIILKSNIQMKKIQQEILALADNL